MGVCTYSNGEKYEGELKGGTFNGRGVLTCPDGKQIKGEFKDGKPLGGEVCNDHSYKMSTSSEENVFVGRILDFYNQGDDKAIFKDSVTSRFSASSDFAAFDFYRLAFDVHHDGGIARHYFVLMFQGKKLLIDGWAVRKDGRFLFAQGNLYDMPLEPEDLLSHIPRTLLKDVRTDYLEKKK